MQVGYLLSVPIYLFVFWLLQIIPFLGLNTDIVSAWDQVHPNMMIRLGLRALGKCHCTTLMRCIELRDQRRMVKGGMEDASFTHVSVHSHVP